VVIERRLEQPWQRLLVPNEETKTGGRELWNMGGGMHDWDSLWTVNAIVRAFPSGAKVKSSFHAV
jgi:hypothetical protein